MRALLALSLGLLLATSGAAQSSVEVTGRTLDAADGLPLPGATVLLVSADSARVGAASGADGRFRLAVARGEYELRISFVGYTTVTRAVTVGATALALGEIELAEDAALLEGVDVAAVRQRVEVRGDTTAFNADAFPVNPDATAEDLVAKLPGVTVENGTVTAEGETVQRVLIDGREFFGTDVQAALNTLPAEMIKEVQVFDRASEESRFSGFDDGDAEKTLNIVTRAGTQNSQFGRVYAGAGPEGEYLAGGNTTVLKGDRRITIVGLANNVDQQNFAAEDLAGIASGGGGRGRRGGRGGGGDVGSLLQNESDGVASANALGVSYSDVLAGGKLRLSGSTFVNTSETLLDAGLTRSTLTDGGISQLYDQTDVADTDNANARATLRAQYDLSDRTQLTFEPEFSLQNVDAISDLRGITRSPDGTPLALTTSDTDASAFALSSEVQLGVRHRFAARGRTLSLSLQGALGDQSGETTQATETSSPTDDTSTFLSDQLFDTGSDSRALQARLSYTEPLSETTQLQFNYRPQISRSTSDQNAFLADDTGAYTIPDASFTNAFEQQSFVQRGGISLRTGSREANAQVGFDLQHERLEGEQFTPEAFTVDRSFWSYLPSARARVTLSEGKRLDLNYRASTRTPSATQLSSLVDNSNPLLLTTGNPDLDPSTTHSLRARFNSTDAAGGSVLFGFISGSYAQNYIGSSTILAAEPVTTASGVIVPAGGQLTQPQNVDGYWNGRALVSYGRPIGLIKSNANMSFGGSYTRAPGLVNDALNISDQFGLDGRVFIGSAISPRVDFSLEYGARYSVTTNTDAPALDDATVRHLAGAKLAWLPWGGLSLGTNLNALYYTGLDDSIDPSQILWSAKAGYKFLPGDVAEVSLSVYDILSQQQDVERTVTELYIQDARTEALGRYVMLNLTYRLSNFGQGNARGSDDGERGGRGDRGGFGGRGD